MTSRGLIGVLVVGALILCACGPDDEGDAGIRDSGHDAEAGYCECYGYTICCDGVCVDPRTDDQNCGECGVVCQPDQRCHQTTCVARCLEPFEYCGGECLDTAYDEDHCGQCDNPCDFEQICMNGSCIDVEPEE